MVIIVFSSIDFDVSPNQRVNFQIVSWNLKPDKFLSKFVGLAAER